MKIFIKPLCISVFIYLCSSALGQFTFQPHSDFVVTKNSDTLSIAWAGGFNAPQFSRVDLNLDGVEDLIIYDRADYQVIPLINIGGVNEIKYRYAPQYKNKFPATDGWMLARDFNNNGKKDLFYNGVGGDVSISRNISDTELEFTLCTSQVVSDQYPGGNIGIYVSSEDIPAIADINGDGDMDILAFGVLGSTVEYHKSFRIENNIPEDSCSIYELKNYCWGHFTETGTNTNKLNLFDTCSFNVPWAESGQNPFYNGTGSRPGGNGSRHAGSTITAFDNNGDSVMDLLLGDVSFDNIVMGLNGGTLPDQNSSVIIQDTAFPSYDTEIHITNYPATFIEDIDNDSINDLVVAPNTNDLAENYKQIWFYKNMGTNKIPVFRLQPDKLFEKEVIDLGSRSIPEMFDYNADGLMDLVVSNYGYFNRDSVTYECKISLYENKGTATNPVYDFVTDDYDSIFSLKLGLALHPTFGDIDNDGDQDMVLGNSEGYLHLLTNTAGAGNTASFTVTTTRIQDDLSDTIDVGQFSAPQLFDFDNDGDLDLIIGRVNGWISYYENVGNPSNYDFKKITDSLGRVQISEWWDTFGAVTGFTTPRFYRDASGNLTMYTGSYSGGVYKFTGINTANPRQTFIIDTVIRNNSYGRHSVPTVGDFDNDGNLDIISGNNKGGLNLFTWRLGTVSIKEQTKAQDFNLFPNPSDGFVTIELPNYQGDNQTLRIIDISGKLVVNSQLTSQKETLDLSRLKKGVYFVSLYSERGIKTRKLIIQ